jgi:hypothetical protein
VLGESQFGFREGKGNRHCAEILCLVHKLAEIFDRVSWAKLTQILKRIGIDWREIDSSAIYAWIRVLK